MSGNGTTAAKTPAAAASSVANTFFFSTLTLQEAKKEVAPPEKWFQTAYFSYIHLGWRVSVGFLWIIYVKFFKFKGKLQREEWESSSAPEYTLWFANAIWIPVLYFLASHLKTSYSELYDLVLFMCQIAYFATMYFYIKKSKSSLVPHFRLLFWDKNNVFSWHRFKFFATKIGALFALDWLVTISLQQLIKYLLPSSGESQQSSENQQSIENSLRGTRIAWTILSVLLFAPIFEELIYRRSIIKASNFHTSALFSSALIFGLIHLKASRETIFHLLPYFMGGLVFAWTYKKYKNIWISIFLHFLHNLTALVSLLIHS